MANTLLTSDIITREALRVLHQKLRFVGSINRQYDDRFDEGVLRVVTPEAAVAAKRTPQSTHPDAVAAALAETKEWLSRT